MKELPKYLFFIILLLAFNACDANLKEDSTEIQIAFLADVHLQDVFGDFTDSDYKGIKNPGNGEFVTIRTMESQLKSTRLFNENYFAFLAALDDIANRGVSYVVLPGDFSDDGQAVNIRGLKKILDDYAAKYDITFLAATGNHDPVRPFTREAGKIDYMGEEGRNQAILSSEALIAHQKKGVLAPVITKDIQHLGYLEIVTMLEAYGFFPKKEFLYWETPFSTYNTKNYTYLLASEEAKMTERMYPLPPYENLIPDVSYLVEPEDGLWLLSLDANVYLPKESAALDPSNPSNYSGSGGGYKNFMSHKAYLIDWIRSVAQRAEKLNKTLIVFSHYPMIDFNDDASELIKNLLCKDAMQMHRLPGEDIARIFADAGINIHFGGHMHINDTGIRTTSNGNTLVNVQIPSLAAYIPAYKLLTIKADHILEVETIVIDSVHRFDEMFDLYLQEHMRLQESGSSHIWDKDILNASTYLEFTNWHLKELVRLRFIPREWPAKMRDYLLSTSGEDLLIYASGGASEDLTLRLKQNGLSLSQFEQWTGFDLIYDFYRLRNADRLAINDIGEKRLEQYQLIFDYLLSEENHPEYNDDKVWLGLQEFAQIFRMFLNGAPADHFQLDLESGELKDFSLDPNPFSISLEDPERIVELRKGHYFVDFGKAAFGTVVIESKLSQNDPITVHLGEKLADSVTIDREPGGTIRYQNVKLDGLIAGKEHRVPLVPDKRNTNDRAIALPDTFGVIMPFRYCELENLNIPIEDISVKQKVYHYRFDEKASDFNSSDTVLNQVWEMCKHTIKATSFAGVYVDGDRERIPYEADALINQLSHYSVDSEYSMARRTNEYFIQNPTWPTEWILQTAMLFYYDFLYTGDVEPISKNYEALKLKTLLGLAREDGLISTYSETLDDEFMAGLGFKNSSQRIRDIVDWPPAQKDTGWKLATAEGERDGYEMLEINTVVNSYHYINLKMMAEMAASLGKREDAVFFQERAIKVKDAINEKLFDDEAGRYVDGENSLHASLHANMFPLAFGIVPEEHLESVVSFVKSRGMACSVYGAQFLLEGLFLNGEADYGISLMNATSDRSWWNMIRIGSTMALEAWDMKYKPNADWNHAWGTAPANIITRHLWGITPLKPGFSEVQIKPQLGELKYTTIKAPSANGSIQASYERRGDDRLYMIELPEGMSGEFVLSNPEEGLVYMNNKRIRNPGMKLPLSEGVTKIEMRD